MSDITEVVATAISERLMKGEEIGDYYATFGDGRVRYDGVIDPAALARAAIEAYEKATAEQEMHYQRAIWEAVERMKFTPADTPLMDALKSGRLYK